MLEGNSNAPKFLDCTDTVFRDFHRSCDNVYRQLHSQGIGTNVRQAHSFTGEEQDMLWDCGILGCASPISLQRAVFYYIGKRFCVRSEEEQRSLGPSQFLHTKDPDCVTYVEDGSDNRSGGLAQLQLKNKCIPCPAVPTVFRDAWYIYSICIKASYQALLLRRTSFIAFQKLRLLWMITSHGMMQLL